MRDTTLAWMRSNLPENEITLEGYIGLNWMGDKTLSDTCQEAELVAELPRDLIWAFLAFGDTDQLDIDDLMTLRDLVGDYTEEGEEDE